MQLVPLSSPRLLSTGTCVNSTPCPVQYDTDVVTWSPQGRIHQIEYAMEAVKQGAAAVGLKARRCNLLAPAALGFLLSTVLYPCTSAAVVGNAYPQCIPRACLQVRRRTLLWC